MLEVCRRLGDNDFKASPCWVLATLKRNKKVGINLHGEANDMADEERGVIISAWRKDVHSKIAEVDTPPE